MLLYIYSDFEEDENISASEEIQKYIGNIVSEFSYFPWEMPDDCYVGSIIGEDTFEKHKAKVHALNNLWECFIETEYTLPARKYKIFELLKDEGVQWKSYGNASGGLFEGWYRIFLIAYHKKKMRIAFSISTYTTSEKPDIIKTSINIGINDGKNVHHSLQFVADTYMLADKEKIFFWHSGKMAVGKIGSAKSEEVRNYVVKYYPAIELKGKKLYLGTLTNNRPWQFDDEEIVNLMENFISYALLRDDYRKIVKEKRALQKA